jgi:chaperone required for assembly of F1-ATPase
VTEETPDQRFERLSRDRIVRPMPKRFYKSVSVTDKLEIALDGRIVKTPLKVPLVLPSRALADAVAAEWDAQTEFIHPGAMPLTKLANTAIDRATAERASISAEIIEFAGSDMVCYRADKPESLVALQAKHWDPVIDWARRELDAKFTTVDSIIHLTQSSEALRSVRNHVDSLDGFTFAAAHNLTTLSGSALIALMIAAGDLSTGEAWTAANVDEDWQVATWGKDDEAEVRRSGRLREFSACTSFINLAKIHP